MLVHILWLINYYYYFTIDSKFPLSILDVFINSSVLSHYKPTDKFMFEVAFKSKILFIIYLHKFFQVISIINFNNI